MDIDRIAQADAERFCPVNDKNTHADHERFKRLVRENLQRWEDLRRHDPVVHKWEMLWAYLCKTDACEDPSSILVAERLKFIKAAALRLLNEHGIERARAIPHAVYACNRFLIDLELRDLVTPENARKAIQQLIERIRVTPSLPRRRPQP